MAFESSQNVQSPEERYETSHQEAHEIVEDLARKWDKIHATLAQRPDLQAQSPEVAEIDQMSIQSWFESKKTFIENAAASDQDAKSRMMYQLLEDIKRIETKANKIYAEQLS